MRWSASGQTHRYVTGSYRVPGHPLVNTFDDEEKVVAMEVDGLVVDAVLVMRWSASGLTHRYVIWLV